MPLRPWASPPETKKCRYCFRDIPGEAEVCPLCGEAVVRVSPQFARTLLIVLTIAVLYLIGSSLLERLSPDRQADEARSYAHGLAVGLEAGQRQGRLDRAHGLFPRETLPARLHFFLRGKDSSFREGFEKGFVRSYHQTYNRTGPEPDRP